jgi:drug/metabolite transporter (DMT)-like permease
VGTLLLYVHLLRRHAASTVTALLLLVPPVTAFASALTLGESLHPASLAGMLVALAGVGVVLGRARGALPRYRPLDPAAVSTR